jgi:hypothetical protein
VQREIRLQACLGKHEEVKAIGPIKRMEKGRKNGHKKKEDTNIINKYLSTVMCFQCHKMGLYANQCLLKKKGKGAKQVAVGIVVGVEEDSSKFEVAFSMVSCFFSNIMFSVGWYVDSGASRHMTYDRSLFNRL